MSIINKCFGIIKLDIYKPNIRNKTVNIINVFQGGLCVNLNNKNIILTPYISGVKMAKYISYKDIVTKYGYEANINWKNEHNILHISSMSKLWDYILFTPINTSNLVFNKYSKMITNIEPDIKYNIFAINKKINIDEQFSVNLIHNKLTKIYFYKMENINSFIGTLLYYQNPKSKKVSIIGLTSNNNRILHLNHIINSNINIDLQYEYFSFNKSIIAQMNIIQPTLYPKIRTKFKLLNKNDIILEINKKTVNNCKIYCNKVNKKIHINEYLTYIYQTKKVVKITIFRNNKIRYIDIPIDKITKKLVNKTEIKTLKDYNSFSADLFEHLIEQNIFDTF